jgi:hypothetical protein
MKMNVEVWSGRGRLKKRWIDCVRKVMTEMAVSGLKSRLRNQRFWVQIPAVS